MQMASDLANTRKYTVTSKSGVSVVCDDIEDVTRLAIALARADDAMSIEASRTRRTRTPDESAPFALTSAATQPTLLPPSGGQHSHQQGRGWTPTMIRELMSMITESARGMLRMALSIGQHASIKTITDKLPGGSGGFGPMTKNINDNAVAMLPMLGKPLMTSGRPGKKIITFEPSFLAAAKEVL